MISNKKLIVFLYRKKSERFLNESYKANRITEYDEIENPFSQLPDIKKCLNLLKIVWLEIDHCEADDVISTLVKKADNQFDEVLIISTDKDFFQLISDKTYVMIPRGKLSITYNKENFYQKYGIVPGQYVEYLALVGDKSDNISGIDGIGKITASKLLNKYQCIDNIFANLDSESNSLQKN